MKELDFTIHSVMIHDVPRGGSDAAKMVLTDAPIQIDEQLRKYFRSKIATSLKTRGIDVVIDPTQDSTVCDAIGRILSVPSSISEQSRLIAARLHKVQTGVNPPGLVTVIYGNRKRAASRIDTQAGARRGDSFPSSRGARTANS